MSHKLRSYQLDVLSQVEASFGRGDKSVVLTLATGAGKTGIAATWLSRFDGTSLFICPKLDVIAQAPNEFLKWGGNAVAVGSGYARWENVYGGIFARKVIACTPQTAFNRLLKARRKDGKPLKKLWNPIQAIVVDEAHHAPAPLGRPKQVAEVIKAAKHLGIPVLGMTATLWRMSKREGFHPTWDSLVVGPDWEGLRGEWLADVDLVKSRHSIIGAGAVSGMDYREGETHKANRRNPIYTDGVFDYASQYGRNEDGSWKKTIIFAVGQKHALNLVKRAKERGIEVGLLVSSPEILDRAPRGVEIDRHRVNERLRSGELDMVINVNMVTEGYDLPDCECVICARPTLSVALWKQICGRGSRRSEGKGNLVLIDLTDNVERLGDPFRRYRWSLYARDDDSQIGPPVMRRCTPRSPSDCENYMFVSQRACPSCGAEQGQDCDTCGKYRLWDRYEDSKTRCDRCVAAMQEPLPEPPVQEGWLPVSQLRIAKTRHGKHYVSCILADGRRANYFNPRAAQRLMQWDAKIKNGLWVLVKEQSKSIEVQCRENGRWLNVTVLRMIERATD